MSGFGMSAKDKWHLEQTEVMLAPLALLMEADIKPLAKQLFDEVRAEASEKYGDNMYLESFGEQMITKEPFTSQRLAAGLTRDDVRNHWNQPLLMQLLQAKVMELTQFIELDVARQQGNDLQEVARNRRRGKPVYGDPDLWNQSLPVNQCFSREDADIYIELFIRVGRWQAITPMQKQSELLANYSSFNAMVRGLVKQGLI